MLRDAQIIGCADMPQYADMPLLPLIIIFYNKGLPFFLFSELHDKTIKQKYHTNAILIITLCIVYNNAK